MSLSPEAIAFIDKTLADEDWTNPADLAYERELKRIARRKYKTEWDRRKRAVQKMDGLGVSC